jgi:hypothetical protein
MDSSLHYGINGPNVIHETVDGETIIINLLTGRYYSLQATGVDIWGLVQQGASAAEMTRWMSRHYGDPGQDMAELVQQFLEQLLAEELIRTERPDPLATPPTPELKRSADLSIPSPTFTMPVLQKYTDMEDLLLLDPIHEVDDAGWPVAKDTRPGQ